MKKKTPWRNNQWNHPSCSQGHLTPVVVFSWTETHKYSS